MSTPRVSTLFSINNLEDSVLLPVIKLRMNPPFSDLNNSILNVGITLAVKGELIEDDVLLVYNGNGLIPTEPFVIGVNELIAFCIILDVLVALDKTEDILFHLYCMKPRLSTI
jgi:hypothetical protein